MGNALFAFSEPEDGNSEQRNFNSSGIYYLSLTEDASGACFPLLDKLRVSFLGGY